MPDAPKLSKTLAIRRAEVADALALSRLGRDTFEETFVRDYAMPYAPDDLAVFVEETYGLGPTAAILADPAHAFWIAERDGKAVGYALAGPCTLPYPEVAAGDGELKRLYLLGSAQKGGAGSALLDTALRWLERDGSRRIWIGVWSGNLGAQRLYARHGFRLFGEHAFAVGRTLDREFALRRG